MTRFAIACLIPLAACSTAGEPPASGGLAVTALPPGCVPTNDQLIVPGCRIGSVALGMAEAELFRALGSPDYSQAYTKLNAVDHSYHRLHLVVELLDGSVRRVRSLEKASYATREGIRAGSSEIEVRTQMGEPAWRRLEADRWIYCYRDRTSVYLGGAPAGDAAKVRGFAINACNPEQ